MSLNIKWKYRWLLSLQMVYYTFWLAHIHQLTNVVAFTLHERDGGSMQILWLNTPFIIIIIPQPLFLSTVILPNVLFTFFFFLLIFSFFKNKMFSQCHEEFQSLTIMKSQLHLIKQIACWIKPALCQSHNGYTHHRATYNKTRQSMPKV